MAEVPSAPEMAIDEGPLLAYLAHRPVLRLFGIGFASVIVVGIWEAWLGSLPSFLQCTYGLYLMFGMILIPAVVMSLYVVICFGLAIYALVKVLLQTAWRTPG
jgi:hypothetical protein